MYEKDKSIGFASTVNIGALAGSQCMKRINLLVLLHQLI
jgi:hypothetical protein